MTSRLPDALAEAGMAPRPLLAPSGAPALVATSALMAMVCGLAAALSYDLAVRAIVSMWIPSGVVLGVLLRSEKRVWPAVLAGAFAGNVVTDYLYFGPQVSSVAGPVVNGLEGWLAATVVRRIMGDSSVLRTLKGIGVLVLGAAVVANAVTAIPGGLALALDYAFTFPAGWLNWWVGDGLGIVVIAPAVVGLLEMPWHDWRRRARVSRLLEGMTMVIVVVGIAVLAFDRPPGFNRFLASLVFPALMWAAMRMGAGPAAAAVSLFSGIALWYSRQGLGPLVEPTLSPLDQVVQIYAFLVLVTLTVLIYAAALAEREEASARVREREESYRALVETAQDVIVTLDDAGQVRFVNAAVTRLLDRDPADLVGRPALELIASRDHATLLDATSRALRSDGGLPPQAIELAALHRDGREVPVEVVLGAWAARERRFVTVIARDVSERVRAESERNEFQRLLGQNQRLESIGRLAGGVAHDFNNTLTAILGNVDEAIRTSTPDSHLRHQLGEIQKAAERSADLVRQLLGFAGRQIASPRVLDVNAHVAGLIGILSRLIGAEIGLEWRPGPGVWSIRLDPAQLDQIITNLCVNARDAIHGVGRITVETANLSILPADALADPRLMAGDFVVMSITDTGTGMSAEAQRHIFEPFFTTKADTGGSGLGLATVHGIVAQNHGFITVDSAPGRGTTFRAHLRRHEGPPDRPPLIHEAEVPARGRHTILIVEDEPSILGLATTVLRRAGYTVVPASTPEEALHLAGAHPVPLDLLLTDVVMPGMNGRELARRIQADHPRLRLLFTSGYPEHVLADRGIVPADVSFLAKPFSPRVLIAKVQQVLG